MAVQDAAPEAGAITTEQAVGLLTGKDDEHDAPSDDAGTSDEDRGEDADRDGRDTEPESDAPETDDPAEAPDSQTVAAPQFWKAEQKAVFDALPRAAQEIILGHERSRVAATSKAFEEAARLREQANGATQRALSAAAQAQAAMASAPGLDQEIIPGVTDPNGRPMTWAQLDWDQAERTDPRLAGALRATYNDRAQKRDAQLGALAQAAQAAQAQADAHAFNAYVAAESGKLTQLHPKLATDAAKRQAVGRYLIAQGIEPSALRGIGAQELILAEKAMNWDRLNTGRSKTSNNNNTNRAPARPGVRPTAAAAPVLPQKRAVQEAGNRFAQSRSRDDAVALLNART